MNFFQEIQNKKKEHGLTQSIIGAIQKKQSDIQKEKARKAGIKSAKIRIKEYRNIIAENTDAGIFELSIYFGQPPSSKKEYEHAFFFAELNEIERFFKDAGFSVESYFLEEPSDGAFVKDGHHVKITW